MAFSRIPPPRLISWNITLRCPLKCRHCYSDAGEKEVSDPLSTSEAFDILDQIRGMGKPLVILSGGEPMMRDDIFTIARYGTDIGLTMAMGTSGYLLGGETIPALKESGIRSIAISLDSADHTIHDSFRGCQGSWEKATDAIRICVREGFQIQINITVTTPDPTELDQVIALGTGLGIRDYQVFVPVPTGRSLQENYERYGAYEDLIRHILGSYANKGIFIRPTCIPQFRRIADEMGIIHPSWGRGCIAGISYCRIYANGDITPCPYLPVVAGNIRKKSLSEIWENSEVFLALRDFNRLQGKCGRCNYRDICGGCRARSFSQYGKAIRSCGSLVRPDDIDGELCAADPLCPYTPGNDT